LCVVEHHVIEPRYVPERGTPAGSRREPLSLRLALQRGFRATRGFGAPEQTLRGLRRQVVLLQDCLWAAQRVAQQFGAVVPRGVPRRAPRGRSQRLTAGGWIHHPGRADRD
jgi:hypothetical protein